MLRQRSGVVPSTPTTNGTPQRPMNLSPWERPEIQKLDSLKQSKLSMKALWSAIGGIVFCFCMMLLTWISSLR